MNIALDLSILKHISLTDAVNTVIKAEQGRFRGLTDLGISIKGVTAGNVDLVASQDRINTAMVELEARTEGGRKATTDLEQKSNQLSNRWQTLANSDGPVLLELTAAVLSDVTSMLDAVDRFGNAFGSAGTNARTAPGAAMGQRGRALGGLVLPNDVYTVGERGPERLVMGPSGRGGYVIPNAAPAEPENSWLESPEILSRLEQIAVNFADTSPGSWRARTGRI
jgi:hypothetical protein